MPLFSCAYIDYIKLPCATLNHCDKGTPGTVRTNHYENRCIVVSKSPSNLSDPEYARFAYETTTAAGPCKPSQPIRYRNQRFFEVRPGHCI